MGMSKELEELINAMIVKSGEEGVSYTELCKNIRSKMIVGKKGKSNVKCVVRKKEEKELKKKIEKAIDKFNPKCDQIDKTWTTAILLATYRIRKEKGEYGIRELSEETSKITGMFPETCRIRECGKSGKFCLEKFFGECNYRLIQLDPIARKKFFEDIVDSIQKY